MIDRPLYVNKIRPFIDKKLVKILTGVRRSGKSTLLKLLMELLKNEYHVPEERIVALDFDSSDISELTADELYQLLKSRLSESGRTYFFLDEIQNILGWEQAVNTIASYYDSDVYVTGSNSRMMSSEFATFLTGRYISFAVYTLSFAEFLSFNHSNVETVDPHRELSNYLRQGGFPVVSDFKLDLERSYWVLREVLENIINDVINRNKLRNSEQLKRIVRYVFDNVGNTFSAKAVADYFKAERRPIDVETVLSYLDKLCTAFLLHRCPRYDVKGKEILKIQEKYYLADTSLRSCLLGSHDDHMASNLENLVFLELKRRGYEVYVGKQGDGEVDFVAVKRSDKLYVQVAQEITSPSTRKREYDRLLDIRDNYPKYVLRSDEFIGDTYEGIKTMHIADFLLSSEY